jgi:hypothetical protein
LEAEAKLIDVFGASGVASVPGTFKCIDVLAEERRGFRGGTPSPAQFALVFAIGFAMVDCDELMGLKPGEIRQKEGAQGGTKVAPAEAIFSQAVPLLFRETVCSEAFVAKVDGDWRDDLCPGGLFPASAHPPEGKAPPATTRTINK